MKDAELAVDFTSETTPDDVVTVVATEPLTDNELWDVHQAGEWTLWRLGECVARGRTE